MPLSSLQSGDRKIAIAVDLSDESAYAVKWAVANYLRPGDQVSSSSYSSLQSRINELACSFLLHSIAMFCQVLWEV